MSTRIAISEQDLLAAQRLRYEVFVAELGGTGAGVDHDQRLETDEYDQYCDHLILVDPRRSAADLEHVVGAYRLLRGETAASDCGFYSSSEFDLSPLIESGRSLVELGRSCVHPDVRAGAAIFQLWNRLADYVLDNDIEIMFGVASFHGTDREALLNPLSYLHCRHLAPKDLRVTVQPQDVEPARLIPCDEVDRREALKSIPPLIKSYLRLGGFVGEGAYFDFAFNTTDVCLVVDTGNMSEDRRSRYVKYRGTR